MAIDAAQAQRVHLLERLDEHRHILGEDEKHLGEADEHLGEADEPRLLLGKADEHTDDEHRQVLGEAAGGDAPAQGLVGRMARVEGHSSDRTAAVKGVGCRVLKMEGRIGALEVDVKAVRQVAESTRDVMRAGFERGDKEVSQLDERMTHVEGLLEEMDSKLDLILAALSASRVRL